MNRVETRRSRLLLVGLVLAHLVAISTQVDTPTGSDSGCRSVLAAAVIASPMR